ncbi:MAG TPA: outer membrane beta-barrel protein [Thermoanaerobaculia bacterium]|nr:outer membrane beta-barrel protein [Thermoanaerobaculia bacterium]
MHFIRTGSIRNRTFLTLLVLVALALPAAAQFEITPTVAYRSDDFREADPTINCVTFPCDFSVESGDAVAFGVVAGFGFADGWAVEVLASRWSSEIELNGPGNADFEVTHLQAGLAYTWGRGNVRPFVGAAAGQSQVDNEADFGLRDAEDDAFSWSAGGGVKIGLTELLALRLEARGYWVDLDDNFGGSFMQQEIGAGLTFRF